MKRLFTFFISCFLLHVACAADMQVVADSSRTGGSFGGRGGRFRPDTIVPVAPAQYTPSQYNVYKRRLDSIKKDVPLDYNEYVQGYIDFYTAPNKRNDIGRILGLSKYYFPIYEKAFTEAGVPEEIKYLSIVESELNPIAVSRAGATGPWQFLSATGRLYGLAMDDYVDERRDPIQASIAAAAYLKDAYLEFGDWLLAIAAYNSGKNNIERAIAEAGTADFWAIRQYLPPETRNYVPAYIAVSYVMNYYNKYHIFPQSCDFAVKTDTLSISKNIPLSIISQVTGIDMRQLSVLNPVYKRLIVNGTKAAPRRLIIPQMTKENYALVYEAMNNDVQASLIKPIAYPVIKPVTTPVNVPANAVAVNAAPARQQGPPEFYTVAYGETLDDIAAKYGLDPTNLRKWNHLLSNKAPAGAKIRLTLPQAANNSNGNSPAVKNVSL